jgi:hypothetical protein
VAEFNPELPYATIRHISGKVQYSQLGTIFTRKGIEVGPDTNYQPPKDPESETSGMLTQAANEEVAQENQRSETLRRAAAKLSGVPQDVIDARRENMAALQAEEKSE